MLAVLWTWHSTRPADVLPREHVGEAIRAGGRYIAASPACWILALSTLNSLYQLSLPGWIKARGMSFYLMVFQGGGAVGSAVMGLIAERAGLSVTLTTPSPSSTGWPSTRANNPDLRPSQRDVPAHDKLVELRLFCANGAGQRCAKWSGCQVPRQYRFAGAARASFSYATTAT